MNTRHKRALLRSAILLVACAYPLWFFYKHQRSSVEPDIAGFGVAPAFTLNFANRAGGLTNYDAQKQLTVIAVLKDSCPQTCPETAAFLQGFKKWADESLRLHSNKITQPRPIGFLVQTNGAIEGLPQDWSIIAMEADDPYLVPNNRRDAAVPALVLIDENGFFRAYEPIGAAASEEILRRELSRMISSQYLYHYVNEQSLMWDRTKGAKAPAK